MNLKTNKMKQTAVEFLIEMFDLKSDLAIIDQAKEMEKQQIIDSYRDSRYSLISKEDAERDYNEKFKNK